MQRTKHFSLYLLQFPQELDGPCCRDVGPVEEGETAAVDREGVMRVGVLWRQKEQKEFKKKKLVDLFLFGKTTKRKKNKITFLLLWLVNFFKAWFSCKLHNIFRHNYSVFAGFLLSTQLHKGDSWKSSASQLNSLIIFVEGEISFLFFRLFSFLFLGFDFTCTSEYKMMDKNNSRQPMKYPI